MNSLIQACVGIGLMLWSVLPTAAQPTDITGTWAGKLDAAGLRIVVKIKKTSDGTLSATMDSPDQGAFDLPLDNFKVDGNRLTFEFTRAAGRYEGTVADDGNRIDGTWTQGGASLPLNLSRSDEVPAPPKRPQNPKKPYPYIEEEVTYENASAGITLAGTLTRPKGAGPYPAVVLISGSGAQDRDETVFGHRPFWILADYLTRREIAVLRVDDRGVGGSTGNVSQSTSADFAQDALAGVAFLKGRKEIEAKKIGLIGHSEGGIVAPMAAARSADVAFIVLMAGTGLTGEEILYMQGELIARAEGSSEEDIVESRNQQERIFSALKAHPDNDAAEKALRKLYEEDMAKLSEEERKKEEITEEQFQAQIKQVLNPWFRYFLTYDPNTALRKVRCPVLAINGEKDLQVPPKENLAAIEEALKEGGNPDHTLKEMRGLNHLFQTAETGAISEYVKIEETISPEVLKIIGDWIVARTR